MGGCGGEWGAGVETAGGECLDSAMRSTRPNGVGACGGMVASLHLNTSVLPFILRGVTLRGIHSVHVPRPRRLEAWRRLDEDLDRDLLASMTRVVGLDEVPAVSGEILGGGIRGRVVVDVNA